MYIVTILLKICICPVKCVMNYFKQSDFTIFFYLMKRGEGLNYI